MQTNNQLELAFNYVQYTGKNIFLTGKAGTGKTTFLKRLKEKSPKRMIVVAPTGVAAINAGGVTIHSFFQLSFGPQIENAPPQQNRFSKEKINIIRSLDLLVIDEISMVRADLLDAIDRVLRRFRNKNQAFGGAQLLMIGDLQQLSPIVKNEEWSMLKNDYDTVYFFSSKSLRESPYVSIELTHVFRQQDPRFISLLNKVRDNKLDQDALDALNQRHIPDFNPHDDEGFITLCTHNIQAQRINETKLQQLTSKKYIFSASVEGKFPEYSYPTDFELQLKLNAQVMFIKNDPDPQKLFYNGKIGKITRIEDEIIYVLCPNEEDEITVSILQWDNIKYSIDTVTSEIKETVEGSFRQFPLKLAWAITIHKSQGLTFERAIIDAQASFAHGQVYVALSRCKTMEGMVLSTPISNRSIINDSTVSGFIQKVEQNQPTEGNFGEAKLAYQRELLMDMFSFDRVQKLMKSVNKLMQENDSSIPRVLTDYFKQILSAFQNELAIVANKFQNQIEKHLSTQADVEENAALQERIKDAAKYFYDKVKKTLFDGLQKVDLEIDNKALRKQIDATVKNLSEEIQLKLVCFEVCKEGFGVKKLLDTRAKAMIENPTTKKQKSKEVLLPDSIPHPELYSILRLWRLEKTTELGIPAYMIFSQKTLIELVNYLPTKKAALKNINGLGSKKIEQFGDDIIQMIQLYCNENKIENEDILLKEVPKKKKAPKEDTKKVSLEMFQSGKTIAEIANERGFVPTTIESHLAHYIGLGELDVNRFLSPEKLKKIIDHFKSSESISLVAAKEKFGDEFSYGELRMGLSHFNFLGFNNP